MKTPMHSRIRGFNAQMAVLTGDNYSHKGQDMELQTFFAIISSEQMDLWKNIILPVEGPRKSFSFARHGGPLNLYHTGNPSTDAPKLHAYFTADDIKQMFLSWSLSKSITDGVHCRKIITGDPTETNLSKAIHGLAEDDNIIYPKVGHCKKYIKDKKFITSPVTMLENNFSLAYSILVYTDFVQFQRLLRMIYRPQNIYCIHIDKKSDKSFSKAIRNVANCFDNVFVSRRSVDVRWGEFSVLEPELICMKELLRRQKKWKYFINLTGQEFPLRTNYELVKILSSINGSNLVEGSVKRDKRERWKHAGLPPHGITPVKGGIHVVLNRQFVDFAINSKVAKDLLNWCRKVQIPDELFFPTLNNNPQLNIPGSYKGPPETDDNKNPLLARFKNWEDDWPCRGKYVRGICVFGVGDLPFLATREELFANKFHQKFQPVVIDCLEELLNNRTIEEAVGTLVFDVSYYKTRDFVSNKV